MTNYHLQLKGYVGGMDFDSDYVDYILAKNKDIAVQVLIDSLGGSLATALSVVASFKNHGNVTVHFVGMNASAATIASLGAKHITMDSSAMYLVHKCSSGLFEYGNFNADQLKDLIDQCKKMKSDLEKVDANVAEMYAAKCKKKPEDLMKLMKAGGWLTAKEALDWGFVDEITDLEEDSDTAPHLTEAIVASMSEAGMPIPNIPVTDKSSGFSKVMNALYKLITTNGKQQNQTNTEPQTPKPVITMNKTYTLILALLATDALAESDGKITLTTGQLSKIEDELKKKDSTIKANADLLKSKEDEFTAKLQEASKAKDDAVKAKADEIKAKEDDIKAKTDEIQAKQKTIDELTTQVNALKSAPGTSTKQIVDDKTDGKSDEFTDYMESRERAEALFNLVNKAN